MSKAEKTAAAEAQKPPADVDDKELVRRTQAGDAVAFRALYDRYHQRVYAVAFSVVKNQQDALDAVQDAFVKVHRHIAKFEGSSSFYTWLYRITMNLCIDKVRRKKKAANVEYDDQYGREDDAAGDGALLPRLMNSNPAKTVIRQELIEQIRHALGELPEYHREVIVLREIEGLSYEEMAETLGVPKGTIMSRLFHARKKMQQSLAPYVQGELRIEG